MFKTVTARALLGVAALGVAGGTTALAASPSPSAAASARAHRDARDHAAGTIVTLTDTQMTVERVRRDPKTKASVKDDTTVGLNSTTAVYAFGNKTKLGLDALKVGQQVAVGFASDNSQKVAKRIVIMPDHRAGRIVSKDPDGKSFTIRNRDGALVRVTTTDQTRYLEGSRKHRQQGSYADLKVGDRVLVLGQEDSQHVFNAQVVHSAAADKAAAPAGTAAP